jgi:hypothetical protein
MKNFRTLLGLTAMVLLPMAAQADMKAMSADELSAVEGQSGKYSLTAGTMSLFTFDTAVLAATPASGVYALVNTKAPTLIPNVRTKGLATVNTALAPVSASLAAQLQTIPFIGGSLASAYTPISVGYTP